MLVVVVVAVVVVVFPVLVVVVVSSGCAQCVAFWFAGRRMPARGRWLYVKHADHRFWLGWIDSSYSSFRAPEIRRTENQRSTRTQEPKRTISSSRRVAEAWHRQHPSFKGTARVTAGRNQFEKSGMEEA